VEELLPDFIKKIISIKWQQLGSSIVETEGLPSIAYSISFGYEDIDYRNHDYLMLRFDNQGLTFGWCAEFQNISHLIGNYENYHSTYPRAIESMKRYNLPNQYHCYLTNQRTCLIHSEGGLKYRRIIMFPQKCIPELLESIISANEQHKAFKKYRISNIQVARALEAEKVLGYSAKRLIHIISHTFKKVFPLFFMFSTLRTQNDSSVPNIQYFRAYEKEFNREYNIKEISEITGFQTSEI
jgi:hypothetical protein